MKGSGVRRAAGLIRAGCVATALVAGVACESGPSGPGTLGVIVESATLTAAAVVLEVRGVGIRGFTSNGPLQLFWAPASAPGGFKVVLVNPGPAIPLTFSIQVDDLGAVAPTGTVIEATSVTNLPIRNTSGLTLRVVP
jgi:hypothetical protein